MSLGLNFLIYEMGVSISWSGCLGQKCMHSVIVILLQINLIKADALRTQCGREAARGRSSIHSLRGFQLLCGDRQKLNKAWATSSLVDTVGLFLQNEAMPRQSSKSRQKCGYLPWKSMTVCIEASGSQNRRLIVNGTQACPTVWVSGLAVTQWPMVVPYPTHSRCPVNAE